MSRLAKHNRIVEELDRMCTFLKDAPRRCCETSEDGFGGLFEVDIPCEPIVKRLITELRFSLANPQFYRLKRKKTGGSIRIEHPGGMYTVSLDTSESRTLVWTVRDRQENCINYEISK